MILMRCTIGLLMAITFASQSIGVTAELKPIAGITAFGGAERGGDGASGVGGLDLVGLVPLASNVGLQGGLNLSGGQGFRFGLNAGPVINFGSSGKDDVGKVGLFVDYEHHARQDFNYVALRGTGAYFLNRFDLLGIYSQPVSSVKRFGGAKLAGINELRGILRYYPTDEVELNAGALVNSFAGPGRKENGGVGVGGSFGVSFKLFDPIVIRLVDAKFDNRERYKITSGIEFIYGSPLKDWTRSHASTPGVASGASGVKSTRRPPNSPDPDKE